MLVLVLMLVLTLVPKLGPGAASDVGPGAASGSVRLYASASGPYPAASQHYLCQRGLVPSWHGIDTSTGIWVVGGTGGNWGEANGRHVDETSLPPLTTEPASTRARMITRHSGRPHHPRATGRKPPAEACSARENAGEQKADHEKTHDGRYQDSFLLCGTQDGSGPRQSPPRESGLPHRTPTRTGPGPGPVPCGHLRRTITQRPRSDTAPPRPGKAELSLEPPRPRRIQHTTSRVPAPRAEKNGVRSGDTVSRATGAKDHTLATAPGRSTPRITDECDCSS